MAEWPISISEAARRLDVPITTAGILVKTHEIATVESPYQPNFKGLMPEAYEQLRAKSGPFKRSRREDVVLSA